MDNTVCMHNGMCVCVQCNAKGNEQKLDSVKKFMYTKGKQQKGTILVPLACRVSNMQHNMNAISTKVSRKD